MIRAPRVRRLWLPVPNPLASVGAVVFLIIVNCVVSIPRSRADEPEPTTKSKLAHAQLQAYLPTLLQKAQLEIERGQIGALEGIIRLFRALKEGGDISQTHLDTADEMILRCRLDFLQRQTDYTDSLDQFKLRFNVPPGRLQEMEESTLLPLTRHARRYEAIFEEYASAGDDLSKKGDPELASKLRTLMRHAFTNSNLVKDTQFRTQCPRLWDAWEMIAKAEDHKAVQTRLSQMRQQRQELLDKQADLELKNETLSPADERRLRVMEFEIGLGELELGLRYYEERRDPTTGRLWKDIANAELRRRAQGSQFHSQVFAFALVLAEARNERLKQARQSWPQLPSLRLGGLDLLTCNLEQAERQVATLFLKPEAALAGKARVRKLRTLAESYKIQQRLFELALLSKEGYRERLVSPPSPQEPANPADGVALAPPVKQASAEVPTQQLLTAQRSFGRVNGEVVSTWIAYQSARLDFYHDLGVMPP